MCHAIKINNFHYFYVIILIIYCCLTSRKYYISAENSTSILTRVGKQCCEMGHEPKV